MRAVELQMLNGSATDTLKVNSFAPTELSLIKCCAELCAEIAIKKSYRIIFVVVVRMCQKYEKVLVLQVLCLKVKCLRRF